MPNQIAGDGKTFAHHILTLNLEQVFHHDIPKATGYASHEAKVLKAGWEKLDIVTQNALLHGTGILKIVADDLDAVPTDIANTILGKFTDVTKEDLQVWLGKVTAIFTGVAAIPNADLETTIKNLQDYLKGKLKDGSELNSILSAASQILAVIINPDAIIAQIATYAETAYQIIKSIFGKK